MGRADQGATAIAMACAGLLGVASAGLDWNVVSREGSAEVLRGTGTTAGLGTLAFGFVLLVVAARLVWRGRRTGGRAASIAGVVVGLFMLGVNTYSVAAPGEALAWLESEQLAEIYGLSEDRVETVLRDAIDRGELRVTAEAGAWAGAAAGLIGTMAGVAGARRSGRIREQNALGAAASPAP